MSNQPGEVEKSGNGSSNMWYLRCSYFRTEKSNYNLRVEENHYNVR
jgi:hypothetical protein